jgi:hypothetical protein
MKKFSILAVAGAIAVTATVAFAAVTFDPAEGTGFVGKGDVQEVYGWNNKALQDNADFVQFRATSEVVTEVSWVCTNANNDNTQERERTTTVSVSGVLSTVARDDRGRQVTGFHLTGYDGDPQGGAPVTEGQPLNSCPSGPWTLTTPAGEPELVSSTTSLEVSIDGTTWDDIE